MSQPITFKALLTPWRRLLAEREFVVLLISQLVLGMAYSFVVPFYSMFGTIEVGMSNWMFGIFMTITSIAGIIISTALARWSDTHFSRRSILLLSCLCGALGYGGYAYERSVLWLTVIGSVALGIASISFAQLFAAAREALGRHGIADSEAPLYMNIFRLLFSLAWTIGPVFRHEGSGLHWLDFALVLAMGAPWLAVFWNTLAARALVPAKDPYFKEAMAHGGH